MAKRNNLLIKAFVPLALLGGTAYAAVHYDLLDKVFKRENQQAWEGAPVKRGNLTISETVRGNLKAADAIELKAQIEGESKIIFLAEEGSLLKKGDVVAEFDVAQFEEKKNRQEIEVKNAEAAVIKAQEQLDIQNIQNQSDLSEAELQLRLAKLDLEKYTIEGGEWTNELAAAEEAIIIKEENLSRAQKDLVWTEKLYEEGFVQRQQFETDQLAVQRAEIELTQSRRDLDLKRNYGHQRRKAELESSVGTRERNIEKVRKQARSRIADLEASLESSKYRLERERKELKRYTEQLNNGTLVAPAEGYFVLERTWRGRTIKEGDEVWGGTDLGTIPNSDSMVVNAAIHETKLKKIKPGLTCKVRTDAFPELAVNGRVSFVAIMASEQNWRRGGNEKMYKATIELEDTPVGFRPGMSCYAEILIDELEDALYIPRQSVLFDGGETIVFVPTKKEPQRRVIEVGLDNNSWVQVVSGLEEGEIVLLAPPASFRPSDEEAGAAEDSETQRPQKKQGETAPDQGSGKPKGRRPRPGGGGGKGEAKAQPQPGSTKSTPTAEPAEASAPKAVPSKPAGASAGE